MFNGDISEPKPVQPPSEQKPTAEQTLHEDTYLHQIHRWINDAYIWVVWVLTELLHIVVGTVIVVGLIMFECKFQICKKVIEAAERQRLKNQDKLKRDDNFDELDGEEDDELVSRNMEMKDLTQRGAPQKKKKYDEPIEKRNAPQMPQSDYKYESDGNGAIDDNPLTLFEDDNQEARLLVEDPPTDSMELLDINSYTTAGAEEHQYDNNQYYNQQQYYEPQQQYD